MERISSTTTFGLLLASVLVLSAGAQTPNTSLIAIHGTVHPRVLAATDNGVVSPAMQIQGLQLYLAPTRAQRLALSQLLSDQRNPGNSEYGRWLTPAQFGAVFGVSSEDESRLRTWLNSQGFTDVNLSNSRTVITFTGSAGQAAQAFRTEIHKLTQNGEPHFANVSEIAVPAPLAGLVQDVRGLNDFYPHSHIVHNRSVSVPQFTNIQGHHGLAPGDIATIYDLQSIYQSGIDGSGITAAVIGDATLDPSDIAAYRAAYNLPATLPTVVIAPGRGAGTNSLDLTEADLDLELLGAVAPHATLIYVNSENVYTALQYAIDQNLAQIVSMSFGGCEADNGGLATSEELLAEQANAQGITLLASSGDSGAADCDSGFPASAIGGLAVDFPASLPGFTGVGGTSFAAPAAAYFGSTNNSQGGSALSYIPEIAWNELASVSVLDASGGGVSILYSKPSWQQGNGVPADGFRDVPDVAFFAGSSEFGYIVCSAGDCASGAPNSTMGEAFVTGTSAATPVFAGIVALLNHWLLSKGEIQNPGLGNINPQLYSLAAVTSDVYHDVTKGNNVVPCQASTVDCTTGSYGYSAGPGYDQVTGLGSVDAYNLLREWNKVAITGTTMDLTASSATIVQGNSVTLTATVTGAAGATSPAGTVMFYSSNQLLGSATLNQSGVATLIVTTLPPGINSIQADYAGSSAFGQSISGLTETVLIPTTTTLSSGWAQAGQGTMDVLTASVSVTSGVTATAGTVTFYDGTTQVCTAPVQAGTAFCNTSTLPVGADTVTASYSGTSTLGPSTSTPITVTVSPAAPLNTTTTLTVSRIQASLGTTITITVSVQPTTGTTTPAGTVTFYNGSTSLGVATLSNGAASTATSSLPVGTNSLTASYSGSSSFIASASTSATVTISPVVQPDFTIGASPSNLTVSGGQNALTALTVTPSNGFNQHLTWSCTGLPSGSSCTFGTAVAQANGTSTISLSISTQQLTASSTQNRSPNAPIFAILPLALFAMKRRRAFVKTVRFAVAAAIFTAAGFGITGCAVGTSSTTTPPTSQTSIVTVTASGQGGTSHGATLTLTVN
jgi:hypothetical protein